MTIYLQKKGALPSQRPDKEISRLSRLTPILTQNEEILLHKRYHSGCRKSYNKLFNSHLRLVFKTAKKFSKTNYNLFEDLASEGMIGLAYAIKKFNPRKGRLCSYCLPWIIYSIEKFFIKHCFGNICMGSDTDTKKIFYELKKIGQDDPSDINLLSEKNIQKISEKLNVSKKNINIVLNRIIQNDLSEIWISVHGKKEDTVLNMENNNIEKIKSIKVEAMKLKPLHNRIFIQRNFKNKSLREISDKERISVQRVSFIEKQALISIKNSINSKKNRELSFVI